jgi:hypothetical protein
VPVEPKKDDLEDFMGNGQKIETGRAAANGPFFVWRGQPICGSCVCPRLG